MATRKEGRLASSGGRFVAIGAPVVVGIVLLLSAGVEQRSRKHEPFA